MALVTMKDLMQAGLHFGHQTRKWDPRMRRFIIGERNGIYLIDLKQTLDGIEEAYSYVRDLVADSGIILFVGTKRQAKESIKSYAQYCGMPYISERWLGGTLTNFQTISKRASKLIEYENAKRAGDFEGMPKKEALQIQREMDKLAKNLGGFRNLKRVPDAIFVVDTIREHLAITEAKKLNIKVVSVVDTNCNPDIIDYPIPGNDDAIRSVKLVTSLISEAVMEGRYIAAKTMIKGPQEQAPAEDSLAV